MEAWWGIRSTPWSHDKLGTRYITEWASLDFHMMPGKKVLALLLSLWQFCSWFAERGWSLQDCVLAFVGWIWGAFTYVRFVFLFRDLVAAVAGASAAVAGPEEGAGRKKPGRAVSAVAIVVLLALIVMSYPKTSQLQAGIAQSFPEKALPYVRGLAGKGRLLNEYRWGGYLEWEAPEVKTFIDPRSDIFVENGIMADYAKAAHIEDTFGVLDKYQIQYVLMPRQTAFAYVLRKSPAWKTTYEDEQSAVFERVR